MTVATATDESGPVQYRFNCASGGAGCVNSAWQSGTSYTASGLAAGTQYTFTVNARDSMLNQTLSSAPASATTAAPPPPPPPSGISLTVTGFKSKSVMIIDLKWSGASGPVDVYRNNAKIASSVSGSSYRDNTGRKGTATFTHKVCLAGGTTTCSNTTTKVF